MVRFKGRGSGGGKGSGLGALAGTDSRSAPTGDGGELIKRRLEEIRGSSEEEGPCRLQLEH